MKKSFHIPSVLFVSLLGIISASAGGEGWTTDYEGALKKAAEEKKSLLIDFTGSDWCGWCIKLNKEVFSHDEFRTGVKDSFILVEIDYPNDKSKQTEAEIAQNETLKEKYGINAYPTILLTDEAGKPFASTGYKEGGPGKYVENLNELLAIRTKRDVAFAEAGKLEGVGKAKALVAALQSLGLDDVMVASFYADEIAAIRAADPSDESGYLKGMETRKKFAEFQNELNTLAGKKDFEGALKLAEKKLASGEFEEEQRIQIAMFKGIINIRLGKKEEALKALDEAMAINPKSPLNARIQVMKERMAESPATENKPKED